MRKNQTHRRERDVLERKARADRKVDQHRAREQEARAELRTVQSRQAPAY